MREDLRLYVQDRNWTPRVKRESGKLYCHHQDDPEDHFHLILDGEIYLTNERVNYCISCAEKKAVLTQQRPVLPS